MLDIKSDGAEWMNVDIGFVVRSDSSFLRSNNRAAHSAVKLPVSLASFLFHKRVSSFVSRPWFDPFLFLCLFLCLFLFPLTFLFCREMINVCVRWKRCFA